MILHRRAIISLSPIRLLPPCTAEAAWFSLLVIRRRYRICFPALLAANKSRHSVISIACRADLTSEELLGARSIVAALPSNGEATERPLPLEAAPAIVLFADADQLSDERIRGYARRTA